MSEYRSTLLRRAAGVTKREVAQEIVNRAKCIEGRQYPISVRSLEIWRRSERQRVRIPKMSPQAIGCRIRGIREHLGWTQKDLALAAGINATTLWFYERGSRIPDRQNLVKLSYVLCEPMATLLFGKRSMLPKALREKPTQPRIIDIISTLKPSEDHTGWLPIKEAAELCGNSVSTWTRRAERECKHARKRNRRPRSIKRLPRSGKGRQTWWIHKTLLLAHENVVLRSNPASTYGARA